MAETVPDRAPIVSMIGPFRASTVRRSALAAILLLAFVLRAWNLDWDDGTHLHPDERFWTNVAGEVHNPDDWKLSEVLDPDKSTLNPRNYQPRYVYGTLPLWTSEAAAGVMMTERMSWLSSGLDSLGIDLRTDAPADVPHEQKLRFNTGSQVQLIGRLLSALIDTGTVFLVYLLGRELVDRKVGMLAALLQALTVLHIQYAHFLGSEPWVAFFVTGVVLGSVRLAKGQGGWPTRLLTGVALGLAIGSKLNGVAAAVAPAVAALIAVAPMLPGLFRRQIEPGLVGRVGRTLEPYVLMALAAVVAYRVVQPYDFRAGVSLVFNPKFFSDIEYLQDINSGGNWPWVQPLVGATPLIHPLKQMLVWGLGPALGLATVFGLFRAGRRVLAGERYWAVPLAVAAAYFVLVSLQFYAIIRYLQPVYPTTTTLAAVGLMAGWRFATALAPERHVLQRIIKVAVVGVVALTAFWAFAFVNGVYNQDNARLAAGDWMKENLPAGATVSFQEWDDPIPFTGPHEFQHIIMRPFSFGGDTPQHIELLIADLDQVDYVVESSNKFYDALPLTPARFPQVSTYYETLFDGSLGFELIKTVQNQPSLLGITINDTGAEEAFTLYDHPTVLIWQKTDVFSVERAYELLNPDRARTAINVEPKFGAANASMLPPAEYAAQQSGSSYSEVHRWQPNSFVAMLAWLVLIQAVSFATAPFVLRHAGRSAGAAYGFSKALGLVLFSLPVWLVVSWGWVEFTPGLVLFALVVLLAISAAVVARNRDQLLEVWRRHRRLILTAEAVFVGVFLFVVALRAANPDMWHPARGGEKPMELAYFTAVTGSTTMPPYDPWLAGGSLNYYYMGWFVLAVPTKLLGLIPSVAFNLGVATYAAVAAVTVFSTAALLADLARRRSGRPLPVARTGILALVMFMVIGNLDAFRQVIKRQREDLPLTRFDWWDPSRVNKNSAGSEVTEFPSWTVLFADLHPHFMAMGFFGLGIAGCIALVERCRQGRLGASWALVVGLGIGSGFMRMVHTWDLPTFGLAAAGAIVFGAVVAPGPRRWRVQTAIFQLLTLGLVHLFITSPYRARNQVADSGFHRAESSTNLDDWIAHWGIFLFVGAAYLAVRLFGAKDRIWRSKSGLLQPVLAVVLVGFVGLHLSVGSVAAWAGLFLAAAVALLVVELTADRASTAAISVAAFWSLGFAVMLGVESFTQNADINRLNTVFKFWLQIWHLFAVAGAFSIMWLIAPLLAPAPDRARFKGLWSAAIARGVSMQERLEPRRLFAMATVFLLALSMSFPVFAIRPRSADRFDTSLGPSLDGHLWLEPGVTALRVRDFFGMEQDLDPGRDRPLIDWLQNNVDGRPTIVEAVGGAEYQWWGRININTGLPAVVGWRWHQEQQRTLFGHEVNERNSDVGNFYISGSQDEIDAFLRAYDVGYVIVGTLEQAIASPVTLALFATNPSLTSVFESDGLRIYEVAKRTLIQSSGPSIALEAG